MSNKTRLMVVGFLFANNQVLLIEKQRPAKYAGAGRPVEQVGYLNGIGGVVADGETGIDCLIRKCTAESGIATVASQWIPFHELQDGDATIIFCKAVLNPKQLSSACSPTDEHVGLYDVDRIFNQKVLPNIHWLVAMACDETHNYSISIGYTERGDIQHDDTLNFLSTPLSYHGGGCPELNPAASAAATGPAPDKAGFIEEFREVVEAQGFIYTSTVETLAAKYNVPVPPQDVMLALLVKGDTPQEYEATSTGIALIPVSKGSDTTGAEKTSEGGVPGTSEPAPASPPADTTQAPGTDTTKAASTPGSEAASTPGSTEPLVKTNKK
jgi:hypothetical protein